MGDAGATKVKNVAAFAKSCRNECRLAIRIVDGETRTGVCYSFSRTCGRRNSFADSLSKSSRGNVIQIDPDRLHTAGPGAFRLQETDIILLAGALNCILSRIDECGLPAK